MRLSKLFQDTISAGGLPDLEILALTADSRLVEPGALFVAVSGGESDGHDFLNEAVANGAVALVGEKPDPGVTIPYINVQNSRATLAQLAAAWHGRPANDLVMIGVTGTDGKTTTTMLIHHILHTLGLRAGMISTIAAVIADRSIETGLHVTTPDPMEVQGLLAKMSESGITHCVLETTSHGLEQHRVDACEFDLGVVTNITHEHLDYHGSYADYRRAKARLFTNLSEGKHKAHGPIKTAILNFDDSSYEFLRKSTKERIITYGLDERADVYASDVRSSAAGLRFTLHHKSEQTGITTSLLGNYNVYNCLAALTASLEGLSLPLDRVTEAISTMGAVPGRMEIIDLGQPFKAIVDFAHTPNALRQALQTARGLTEGRVIVVFGSAGLRDKEKRSMMAEISAELADLTVLTAEDPRTEPLDQILEEMVAGSSSKGREEGKNLWRIPDRGEAIRFAVGKAQEGDLVMACGKGHEQSMCFGDVEYNWDDRIAMRAALAGRLGVEGPPMPRLPTSE
jgi:UDP-N-acetylmuramoyl-L-alanyl-D-glutamate--2,6-diaminopimelate ligase